MDDDADESLLDGCDKMFPTARRLDDHIRGCKDRHGETMQRIEQLSEQTRGEFASVKAERERMHVENKASFDKLYSGLWKAVALIAAAVLANYLAQHGFSPLGLNH